MFNKSVCEFACPYPTKWGNLGLLLLTTLR